MMSLPVLLAQLAALSTSDPRLELTPPRSLSEATLLAEVSPLPADGGARPKVYRGYRTNQYLAGAGLHFLAASASSIALFVPLRCAVDRTASDGCTAGTELALAIVGSGGLLLGAPFMSVLGLRLAAPNEPRGLSQAYANGVLFNLLGVAAGGVAMNVLKNRDTADAGINETLGVVVGLGIAVVAGTFLVPAAAGAELEYDAPLDDEDQPRPTRQADRARPSIPSVSAPARTGTTIPVVAFAW
jgi:hypothetical protein